MAQRKPRIRIAPREPHRSEPKHNPARWTLSLDDQGGNGIEHSHDDVGHAFPMTTHELRALRLAINGALEDMP